MEFEDDIRKVLANKLRDLESACNHFISDATETISIDYVRNTLDKHLDSDTVDSLIRIAASKILTSRANSIDFIKALTEKTPEDISGDEHFDAKIQCIEKIFKQDQFLVSIKTYLLPFEGRKLMKNVSSLVDLRPIYNEEHTDIKAVSILPTINLEYYDNDSTDNRVVKYLNITVDEEDVENFVDTLSDLVKKIKSIKSRYPNNSLVINEESLKRPDAEELT